MTDKGIFYLDTSGLNYLAEKIKDFDAFQAIKKHFQFDLYLSPITLWEVLLNSDEAQRDYLIYWAQFNTASHLLKSPTEILLDYIKRDLPKHERKLFRDDPYTRQEAGVTWQGIHRKLDRTIPIDLEALKERSTSIRQLSKNLKSIIEDMFTAEAEDEAFFFAMKKALKNLNYLESFESENKRVLIIATIFLFFLLCIGLELDNSELREYWAELNITDPLDRLDYMIDKYPSIIVRGPLLEMSKMAEVQLETENPKSRGLVHDCLHSVYCYYTDNFLTGDAHFKSLREIVKHPTFEGIILVEEVQQIWNLAMQELRDKS